MVQGQPATDPTLGLEGSLLQMDRIQRALMARMVLMALMALMGRTAL